MLIFVTSMNRYGIQNNGDNSLYYLQGQNLSIGCFQIRSREVSGHRDQQGGAIFNLIKINLCSCHLKLNSWFNQCFLSENINLRIRIWKRFWIRVFLVLKFPFELCAED
jgi:hypothetical protein